MSIQNNDMKVYNSKPSDGFRLKKEMETYELLEMLGIPFEGVDHRAAGAYEDCSDIEAALGVEICKNLFLCNKSKTEYYLLVMPGAKKLAAGDLSKKIGSTRLSFADAEHMDEYLNITPGSVSILGLMYDSGQNVRLLVDRDIADAEYIGCHPCINTTSLKIRVSDILGKFLPYTGHRPVIVELEDRPCP